MWHVDDYQRVLDTILSAPLTLTERDFDVLREFNPGDEARAQAAIRAAQLALVPPALPLQTKAAPPASTRAPWLAPERLANIVATAIRQTVGPLRERVTQLTERVTELEATTARQAATIGELRDENKALGKLVARGLHPPHHAPCLDDLSPRSPKH